MTEHLQRAFNEASKLPDQQQKAFAAFILAELKDEREWQHSFEKSQGQISSLAAEALKEHRAGKTRPLPIR